MTNISTRKEVEKNYSFWSLQKNRKTQLSKHKNFLLNEYNSLSFDDPPSNILVENNITLEVSKNPYR